MQSADTTDRALPDLSLCDQEPIHIPGCIQPRGVLLALAGATLRVLQVSQSCASLLGLSPEALLGRELHALLGADLERAVRAAHARWLRSRKQPASFDWRRPRTGEAFSAYLHASGDTLVLELEAYPESYAEPDRDLYPQQTAHQWRQDEGWLDDALQRFAEVRAEPELEAKLAASATLFRDLTGYDRVMIYRFDAEWHGEVVAEARRADMEPYLGLHYPATDIPVQARRLYTLCPTRIIVDVFDQPSPLTPLYHPKTGAPLDLSLSILRSVSPVHLEYLSNMGVRATLTASLRQGAELWGLIACHHLTPRSIPRRLRELVGWLAEDLAVQIALAEAVAARSYSEQLKAFRAQVMTAMRARGRLAELLSGPHLPSLLGAVGADGVALIQGGEVFTGGVAPDPARILDIADALAAEAQSTPADLFFTDCLSEQVPGTADLADTAAGLLMHPLVSEPRVKLLWFRAEQLRQVTWGGDPDKAALITPEGRLNPRKSFDAWRQTVQLRSARWRCEELESARALAALIDIERREIAEKAVRDSEARLQGMLDHALAMICIIDLDGRYLLVNRKFEAEFGLTGVEVAGKTPDQLLPPAIAEQFMASDRAVIESLQARSCEESIDSPHGVRTLLSNRFPLLDATGQANAICQLSLEITDRLQAEQALRVALTKYKTLFDAFPLGITVCDSDGEIIETNAVSEHMLGLPTEQHLQRRIGGPEWSILRPDGSPMPPREYASVRALREGLEVRDQEMLLLSPDGQRRWLNVTATPLSLDDLGAVILYEDITERKQIQAARQVEQALRESERRFRIMANELPLMIWVHDADLSAAFVNQTCCDYFGKPQEGFIGDGWREALHPDDRERYLDAFLRSTRERQPFHDECRMRRADGQWRWLESFARPIWDADGSFAGIVGSSLDITERKLADDALRDSHRELKRRAEQLGRLTSELTLAEQRERERLAKVLHDHLQQLLVGATFGIDRLERLLGSSTPIPGAQRALASVKNLLEQAIAAARTLVADLSPPILRDGGLNDALEWLARTMRDTHGLTLVLNLEADVSPTREDVRGVVFESVREALFNVVKHAGCDHAEVTVTRLASNQVCIVVQDQGVGFDAKRLTRADSDGTGFGILAMRERLRCLGGRCKIDSEPGQGTRVTLIAPLGAMPVGEPEDSRAHPQPSAVSIAPAASTARSVLRVLLVDDHALVRHGLAVLLEDEPDIAIVGEACDGIDALAQMEGLHPDLVLMDYSMPRMDGLEATRRIKQRWPRVRVIGLSMYREADRAVAMLDAGACAYVDKTAGADALLAAIRGEAAAAT